MDFLPPVFNDVPFGSQQVSACSPHVEPSNFHGIVIAMPKEVRTIGEETPRLPICGFFRLETLPLLNGAEMRVDVKPMDGGQRPFSAPIVQDGGANEPLARKPQRTINPALYARQMSQGYFHIDAARYLPHPLTPGTYQVKFSYGPGQSNIVQVKVIHH